MAYDWTTKDVAEYLGVTETTVQQLVNHGHVVPQNGLFDSAVVKHWRMRLSDEGRNGGSYVEELVRLRS